MKTESHFKLALYLSKAYLSSLPLKVRIAFVLGSVEPDFNLLSYLKGFKVRAFYGHNWENSREYIKNSLKYRRQTKCTSFTDGFYLGRLLHFIDDAFTYPHNRMYDKGLKNHSLYEKALHKALMRQLDREAFEKLWQYCHSGDFDVLSAHANYSVQPMSTQNDLSWIIGINKLLLGQTVYTKHPTAYNGIG